MIKKLLCLFILLCALTLSACGPSAPQAAADSVQPSAPSEAPVNNAPLAATQTIDPCQPEYARVLAQRMHNHMREFDDASTLAAALTTTQLPGAIADLQRIRRPAQDEPVPSACLGKLKDLQVAHMNKVIDTLLALLNGAQAADLQTGINDARGLHDAYTLEFASIMGLTVVTPPSSTPAPVSAVTVSNPGPSSVNLRATPDLNGVIVGSFVVNASATVLAQSVDGKWAQIEIPEKLGEKAWMLLQPVTLSGALDGIPVTTP